MIRNAGDLPLSQQASGTLPDVGGAIQGYFQPMVFTKIVKDVVGFQAVEKANPLNFRGMIQPLSGRVLQLKPEGQRAWSWFLLFADTALVLDVDDVVVWQGKQTRIMARKDYGLYGYVEYHLVQDWEGSGP